MTFWLLLTVNSVTFGGLLLLPLHYESTGSGLDKDAARQQQRRT
jgi:hypothetical protein